MLLLIGFLGLLVVGFLLFRRIFSLSCDDIKFLIALQIGCISLTIPLKLILAILKLELDIYWLMPIFVGLISLSILVIRHLCLFGTFPRKRLSILSFYMSYGMCLLLVGLDHLFMLNYLHSLLLVLVKLTEIHINWPSFVLLAGSIDGESSGYRAARSRSNSFSGSDLSPKLRFGGLVSGLSYNEVTFIRSEAHAIMLTRLNESVAVSVDDILMKTKNPNTHKVIQKACDLSNTPFDVGSVLAMKGINHQGPSFSPLGQALLDLK